MQNSKDACSFENSPYAEIILEDLCKFFDDYNLCFKFHGTRQAISHNFKAGQEDNHVEIRIVVEPQKVDVLEFDDWRLFCVNNNPYYFAVPGIPTPDVGGPTRYFKFDLADPEYREKVLKQVYKFINDPKRIKIWVCDPPEKKNWVQKLMSNVLGLLIRL